METGTVSDWSEEKGLGFITPKPGGKKLFFHINNYSYRHKRPLKSLKVKYLKSTDKKGRACAVDVTPIAGHRDNGIEVRQKLFSLILFGVFSVSLYFLFLATLIPIEVVWLYAAINVITFLTYIKDKSAAERGKWRTPESTLHTLSAFGGWPSARIAQSFLRHKSRKVSFRIMYWVTVSANCGALYWITTPNGSMWLENIIRNIDFS